MSLFEKDKRQKAAASIEKIAIEFQIKEPFFGSLFRRLRKELTPDIETIGLYFGRERIALYINPDFINKLSYREIKAVFEHILLHLCFKHVIHVKTIGGFERGLYNIAAELEVNQRIEGLPRNALSLEDVFGKDNDNIERRREAEYYYSCLRRDIKLESLKTLDNHDFWPGDYTLQDLITDRDITQQPPEIEKRFSGQDEKAEDPGESEEDWEAEDITEPDISIEDLLRKADEDAKGNLPGNLPAGLFRKIDFEEEIQRVNDWHRILRQYLNHLLSKNSFTHYELIKSKRRPNKKSGFPFPSIKVDPASILNLAVCVDGSGSVDNRTFQEFMSEINRLYDREILITLIGFDSEVKDENVVRNYNPHKWLKEKKMTNLFPGELGGGTDFVPAVEVAANLTPKPDCIIMFTDSFDKGNLEPPELPIIFVLSQKNENFYEWAECIIMHD
jgi:predicted metal-dependent peptidase